MYARWFLWFMFYCSLMFVHVCCFFMRFNYFCWFRWFILVVIEFCLYYKFNLVWLRFALICYCSLIFFADLHGLYLCYCSLVGYCQLFTWFVAYVGLMCVFFWVLFYWRLWVFPWFVQMFVDCCWCSLTFSFYDFWLGGTEVDWGGFTVDWAVFEWVRRTPPCPLLLMQKLFWSHTPKPKGQRILIIIASCCYISLWCEFRFVGTRHAIV